MSAPVKTKPEGKPKGLQLRRSAPVTRSTAVKPVKGIETLTIGGRPGVHLLPPEVAIRKKGKQLRRRLGFGLAAVIVLVVAGVGLATVSLLAAQSAMTDQQNIAAGLVTEQAKYADVTKVQSDVKSIQQAQITGTSQEIAWAPYVADIQKTLPAGMKIYSIDASLDKAASAAAIAVPLQGARIATLIITVTSAQSSISGWLNSLLTLKGYVDATPGSVTFDNGSYKTVVTMHINDKALSNRFTAKK